MDHQSLVEQRLLNQRLAGAALGTLREAVEWFGAVQAQDYAAAKWALSLRTAQGADAAIEDAFARGTILRTHVLRPTWHFVSPADIRWMLALTGPHVNAGNALAHRQLELDDATFALSRSVFVKALEGGRQLTRAELAAALKAAGIATNDLRLVHLMMRAELEGLVCSGARQGKQMTYALLDERAPAGKILDRDEALAELTERYFMGHGPATVKDYAWWSGLSMSDARRGLDMVKGRLGHAAVEGRDYWFSPSTPAPREHVPAAFLLPNYDEYMVGYNDRAGIAHPHRPLMQDVRADSLLNNAIVVDGLLVGTWKRTLRKDRVEVDLNPSVPLGQPAAEAVIAAAGRYGEHLGLPVVTRWLG